MRARPRPPIRLLLLLQAEERTGRITWRHSSGERSLLLSAGLVVGAEGQPESFLEYLARVSGIAPGTLGRIERRVRDLFLPLEREVARATGLAPEEIAAARRDFTLAQIAELCLQEEDPQEIRFEDETMLMPGAACQVPPATALADLLMARIVRDGGIPSFPDRILRPTRLFPRLSVLLELAFPWRIPLPRAGGETAAQILEQCGTDRAAALYLLLAGGLLAEEPDRGRRRTPPTVLPGVALPVVGGPLAALEALEQRLAADPFNQEAIEAIERLAADEGWPELLVEMQERLIAKAPPPQRGYYYLRLAALADIAVLPAPRHAEIVSLGRRSLPRDSRLACAGAFESFRRGDTEGAQLILSAAGVTWPPAAMERPGRGPARRSSTELVVRPDPSGLGPALFSIPDRTRLVADAAAAAPVETPLEPKPDEQAEEAAEETPQVAPDYASTVDAAPPATSPETDVVQASFDAAAPPARADAEPEAAEAPTPQRGSRPPSRPPGPPSDLAPIALDVSDTPEFTPDSLGPLMTALEAGDEDTLHAWLRDSLPQLPRVRRASQAILDAATGPSAGPKEHVARFARALGRALDELEAQPGDPERANLRADLLVQLAELFAPIDPAAALVAAARAVTSAPDHEPAAERLERMAIEQRDADTYARSFAVVEEHLEGSHNKWAFAYRQGRTLETEFARSDLAVGAYLRALGYQPRTGAVLAAIERLAKASGDDAPVIQAYKLLAAASDGAQRAYWRSRLVEHGASGSVEESGTDWDDLLDESAPAGHSAPLAAGAVRPGLAAGTPAAAAGETTRGEPARGIEEALLRATPAFGIPILGANLPREDGAATSRKATPPPARPAAPPPVVEPEAVTPTPDPQPEVAATAPVQKPGIVTPTPDPQPEVVTTAPVQKPEAAPVTTVVQPESRPTATAVRPESPPTATAVRPERMVPPPVIQPLDAAKPVPVGREATRRTLRLRLSAPLEPTPTETPPAVEVKPSEVPPAVEVKPSEVPPAVEVKPSEVPPAVEVKPSEVPPAVEAPARASDPFVILEPEYVDKPSAEKEVDIFKDVNWLDDDVEMVIEYPRGDSVPPALPPQAPTEGPAAKVEVGESPGVAEAHARLETDITDLDAVRVLAESARRDERTVQRWVAESILSLFDPLVTPALPPAPPAAPTEVVLGKCGPWEARFMHRAMAIVWEHCAATFAEDLPTAIRPANQISPMGRDHLAHGIADCSDRLAFFRFQVYRGFGGSEVEVLRTRPPSVVVGAELDPSRPDGLTRLAVGVARCVPEHLLPATLAPIEREALMQGLLCAFGPPGCVPRIPPRAASVAQDLWHFIPPRAQAVLRTELASADVAESGAWVTEVHARCLLLGVRVSRDLRTALRLGLAADAAVPFDKPLSEAELREALRWSSITRRLLRAILSEGFQQGFAR